MDLHDGPHDIKLTCDEQPKGLYDIGVTCVSHYRNDIPLVAEHDTWISLDPIVGCPTGCEYCYLRPMHLNTVQPRTRVEPAELLKQLTRYLEFRQSLWPDAFPIAVPICLGNYTDMLMTERGIEYLYEYVSLHANALPQHPVCVVTKTRLQEHNTRLLDSLRHPILLFLSQAFIKDRGIAGIEMDDTASSTDTIRNIQLLKTTMHLVPIHYWRPITPRTVPDLVSAREQLRAVQQAGALCSVAIGLKWGVSLGSMRHLEDLVPQDVDAKCVGDEYMPDSLISMVFKAASALGYPVYRNSSCAIALALKQRESLGTWRTATRRERCEPCSCPREQRGHCNSARKADSPPRQQAIDYLADYLDIPKDQIVWDPTRQHIHVHGTISQELHAQLTHTSGHRIAANNIVPKLAWFGAIVPSI